MEAVEFLEQCGNMRKTPRKFGVQPRQIRKCGENSLKIRVVQEKNPRNLKIQYGTSAENPNLVESLYDWLVIKFQ